MSQLTIFHQDRPHQAIAQFSDYEAIQTALQEYGVRFERWQATHSLNENSTPETIMQAYQKEIDQLKNQAGYITVDVIRMTANHPQKHMLREKFLSEHTHNEDEVRFFVEGQGLFTLHIKEHVLVTLCQKDDLISVPAHTPHWFDMSDQPQFCAIRFFNNPEGWVAHYTGSDIAKQFPILE